jgi:uncharacterized protein (TIGR03067 family)
MPMRSLLSLGLAFGVLALATADDKNPLEGKWVIESLTRDGKDESAKYKGATRVNTGGKYSMVPPAGSTAKPAEGTFTVDAGKMPPTVDMKPGSGQYEGKTLAGIYKLDGDTLTIAFAEPGKDRPTAFESKPGSGVVLVVHKKAK